MTVVRLKLFYICTLFHKNTLFCMQKNKFWTYLFVFLFGFTSGQRHEVGLQLGASNLVGDIGRTNYLFQKPFGDTSNFGIPFYGGVLYRMNFNPYQTLRFNLGYSHVQFADGGAKEEYRRNRKLWGTNSIMEVDALFEYNFFPVNDEQTSMLSPYVFGGLGAMIASTPQLIIHHSFNPNGELPTLEDPNKFVTTTSYQSGKSLTLAIPFGVGLKYKFNYNWALFGEFMFRPTFSDSIDYSVIDDSNVKITYGKDPNTNAKKSRLQESPYREVAEERTAIILSDRQIGNTNSKDWVNSITLGLSYSFGRQPCYCN